MTKRIIKRPRCPLRARLAIIGGKISSALLKLAQGFKLPWGGTSFPGRIALRLDPNILATLSQKYQGFILVTGTNGKTITTALLSKLLEKAGLDIVSNSEGANMIPGLVTALLRAEPVLPSLFGSKYKLAVLEVDEGSLPALSAQLCQVDMIIVTNLFPDQLDRYGSVAALAERMKEAFAAWPDATLVLNADDPVVTSFGFDWSRVYYFSVETDEPADRSKVTPCPCCGGQLDYNSYRYAHLGSYRCSSCDFRRPQATVSLWPGSAKTRVLLARTPVEKVELQSPLTGLYNVYNTAAALTAAFAWLPHLSLASLAPAVASFQAPTGRTEYFLWPDKEAVLTLTKNSAGFNQALATLMDKKRDLAPTLIVAINDLPADGRDISWLEDIDSTYIPANTAIICSGRRAREVAARFRRSHLSGQIAVISEVNRAVRSALQSSTDKIIILCNYTVLAPLRRELIKQGGKTKLG
ncbi:MAG: DUF1727 domain-containing protein [Firmicutes bacterium]|nr:DUF1727 domain-containing protein [Bacillota bacterium]